MGGACSMYRGDESCIQGFGAEKNWEIDLLEKTGVEGRIILRWIFRKWDVGAYSGSSWLRRGTSGGICKRGNEPSVSIKFEEFLD
jgi:hypothetical protein